MPLPNRKITAFAKDVSDLPDKTGGAFTAAQAKAQFDAAPNEVRMALNATIDDLGSTTAGDSGAKNIGVSPISGVTGDDVQEALEDLKAQINGAAVGSIPDGSITETQLSTSVNQKLVPYGGITTNVGNDYSVSYPITALAAGMGLRIQINVSSTGACRINWDGKGLKPIKKANGTDVTNLIAGGIYALTFNGTNFILQGEGGEYGTAGATQVLSGYTFGTDTGLKSGSMANRGVLTITPNKTDQSFPTGYYSSIVGKAVQVAPGVELIYNDSVESNTSYANYTKDREAILNSGANGAVRVKFDFCNSIGGAVAYARIFKNGVVVGTERASSSNPPIYTTYTEDIAVSPNDKIQIYLKNPALLKNFTIGTDGITATKSL